MVKIILLDNDEIKNTYEFNSNVSFLNVKKKIINDLFNGIGYIDINFLLDKTKRTFGKFNLDPGPLPRIFDNRLLSDFGLDYDVLKIKIESYDNSSNINDFSKKKINNTNNGKYLPPNLKKKSDSQNKEFIFDENDFPSL